MGCIYRLKSTRWVDSDGRRVKPGTPGARKVSEESEHWYAKYRQADGTEARVPLGVKDRRSAERMLSDLEQREDRRKAGLIDTHMEAAGKPLVDHVEDWFRFLADSGHSERRLVDLRGRLKIILGLTGWKRLSDITDKSAQAAVARVPGRHGRGLAGTQTRNHYLTHLKQLCHWLVPDRLSADPLVKLRQENAKPDKRHDRREFSLAEQVRLIETTRASGVTSFSLTGPERALLYEVALCTGFRRGELQSLTPDSFDLAGGFVTVGAAYSKHRRRDVQPLPVALVCRLKTWFADGGRLWPHLTLDTARMIRGDLERANIPYVVNSPEGTPLYGDFHALRHSYISAVCRTNAPLKVLKDLARHSAASLTLDCYAKTELRERADVVATLAVPLAVPAAVSR